MTDITANMAEANNAKTVKEAIDEIEQELKDVDKGGKQLHFDFPRLHFGLMTEQDLAHLLGVEVLTLARWRREGKGPSYVRPGKTVFYIAKEVGAWLAASLQKPGQVS